MSDILVERQGAIATVVINRPRMRNAISYAMCGELARVTRALGDDDTVRGLVYRGAGRQALASGADISEFRENLKEGTRAFLAKRSPRFQGR
jgi:enoyl-CoA hydratase/carnithine racemase